MATKVLMVDDDDFLPKLYSTKFISAGFEFAHISNPDGDFVAEVVSVKPDLILMDLTFLGFKRNGVEAAEVLKVDERTKAIPIVFLTNADIEKLAHDARQFSSSIGFLIKVSLMPDELVSKVKELYTDFQNNKLK